MNLCGHRQCVLEPADVLLHGDAKYIDLLEKVLYKRLLSGVGLDESHFLY